MGGLGLVIGSGGMGYLCDSLGWRTSHLVVASITLCFALALGVTVRDTPAHASRPGPAGRAGAVPPAVLGHILRNRQFLFIAGWFCCQFSLHNAFGGLWGGQYLRAVHHLDTVIDVICQCLFLLIFADIALFKHVLQDDLALFRVGFLTADRV